MNENATTQIMQGLNSVQEMLVSLTINMGHQNFFQHYQKFVEKITPWNIYQDTEWVSHYRELKQILYGIVDCNPMECGYAGIQKIIQEA